MKIALYMGTLRGHGSGALGRAVLDEITRQGSGHSFQAWVPSSWATTSHEGGLESLPGTEIHTTRPGMARKLSTENLRLRRVLRAWEADRLFSFTDTSLVSCPIPHCLLVHQAHLAYGPDEWGFEAPLKLRARMAVMARYFRQGLKTVSRVTVQTEDMKRRLCARFELEGERVVVIPSGLGRAWGDLTSTDRSGGVAGEPRLLCVTSAAPHKNLPVLADMLAELSGPYRDVRLTLTVEPSESASFVRQARRRGVLERVDFVGPCSPSGLAELARTATLSIQPSMLESFGLTYYESMAAGLPVIAANRAFAVEACGDAALYARGNNGAEFASHVCRLLDDEQSAAEMAGRGLDRLQNMSWSWPRVAAAYLELITDPALSPDPRA